jgi:hypothetical protein
MKRLLLIAAFLASLHPAFAQAVPATANLTAQDSGTCTTANACLTINLTPTAASSVIQLSGTFSATVQFEAGTTRDGTFTAISGTPIGSTTAVTSATAPGAWRFNVSSVYYIRARVSSYGSGTVAAAITASPASSFSSTSVVSGGGSPASPVNSIQLNANGSSFGASILTENPSATDILDSGSFNPCGPQPYYDVVCFGASGSQVTETGSIGSASTVLTLGAAGDFANGQGIMVPGAGPTSTIAAPTAPSGSQVATVANLDNFNVNPFYPHGITCTGGVATATTNGWYGFPNGSSVTLAGTGVTNYNITATLTVVNAFTFTFPATCAGNADGGTVTLNAGSTTFKYQIVAMDSLRGYSAATSSFNVTSGNALSAQVSNELTWTQSTNAVQYLVYGDEGSGGALTCRGPAIAPTTPLASPMYPAFLWADYGASQTCPSNAPANPPGSATAQDLVTSISSGAGTTSLVLLAAASNAASGVTVEHDDSVAINAAIAAAASNSNAFGSGGRVYIGTGTYSVEGLTFPLTSTHSNGSMLIQINGNILTRTPLTVAFAHYTFKGMTGAPTVADWAGSGAMIQGSGVAPLWHLHGVGTVSDTWDSLASTNCTPSCYYIEQDATGGPTNLIWNNIAAIDRSLAPGSAVDLRSNGFGYVFNGGVYGSGGNSILPTINILDSGGIGIKGTNFENSGVMLTCDNAGAAEQCGDVTLDFTTSTNPYEGGNTPLFTSVTNGGAFNIDVQIFNPWPADGTSGQDGAIVKSSGNSGHGLLGLTVIGATTINSNPVLEGNASGFISEALGTTGGKMPFAAGGLEGQAIDSNGRTYFLTNPAYDSGGGAVLGSQLVSTLPAASATNAGSIRTVTDSTAISAEGQTCVGGGTVPALAFSNGTIWKCF